MSETAPDISIVVPCHNEGDNVALLYAEIAAALGAGERFEVVFVDDGSTDATAARVRSLAACDARGRLVQLHENSGEAAALSAGFHAARAPRVVTIDGDGQNDPAAIPRLLDALAEDGVMAVSGRRRGRADGVARRWPSRVANWLIALLSGLPTHDCGCGLKAYRRELVANTHLPPGMHRFLPAVLGVGAAAFREVDVRDRRRRGGRSHYGLGRVPIVARDLIALPLLVGDRRRNEIHCALATAVVATAGAVVYQANAAAGLAVDALAALCGVAWWGVRRFNRAQESGVYRLCEDTA